jgi:hypothetical protein
MFAQVGLALRPNLRVRLPCRQRVGPRKAEYFAVVTAPFSRLIFGDDGEAGVDVADVLAACCCFGRAENAVKDKLLGAMCQATGLLPSEGRASFSVCIHITHV